MQKVLTAQQIREIDQATIKEEPIGSLDLMEGAADAFTYAFVEQMGFERPVAVFCGPGNNGGDGLAISRMLLRMGLQVRTCLVRLGDNLSPDCEANLQRLREEPTAAITKVTSEAELPEVAPKAIIIDALFGTGLSRPAEGLAAAAIRHINEHQGPVVAVDVPSGLMADEHTPGEAIVEADYTFTFQLPKLAFLLRESGKYAGRWQALDISLSERAIAAAETNYFYLEQQDVVPLLKPRRPFDYKNTFGHALIVAGSQGKMGAAVMCVKAAYRAGAGLVTAYVPGRGEQIMQISVPEAMTLADESDQHLRYAPDLKPFQAVGVGPGMGTEDETEQMLWQLLHETEKPMVLDADALNILAGQQEKLEDLPRGTILTPHPGEFQRIGGKQANPFAELRRLRDVARQWKSVVLLKTRHSAVALPDGRVFFNSSGNEDMGTGGTGDVLTGVLTSLRAQGYSPADAALLGVYLHGLAGEIASQRWGRRAMLALDVVEAFGEAYRQLEEAQSQNR